MPLSFLLWSSLLWLLTSPLYAQTQVQLTGQLQEEQQPLMGATVMLLQLPDSILIAHAISDQEGNFQLSAPPASYGLTVHYLGYQSYYQNIQLAQDTNLPPIVLLPKKELLETVEVTEEHLPIQLKGDTIEYNAQAFATQAHDDVEALLKKLPGVQVDRDGTVKAQGETVDKILVDGKEFFGDNPAAALKNLPADAVDKVAVYDRKSKLAEFSGIEDGVQKKTINLTLKEDKKQGIFGQVKGGYGLRNWEQLSPAAHCYLGSGSIHYFNPNLQVSAIGNLNNLNQPNFTFQDYFNLMGGMRSLLSGGNVNLTINDGDPLAYLLLNNQEGISTRAGGGLNWNWQWNEKTSWNSHYFYSWIQKEQQSKDFFRSVARDNFFLTTTDKNQQLSAAYHQFKSTLEHTFDSSQDLEFTLGLKWNDSQLAEKELENRLLDAENIQTQLQQNNQQIQQGWGINSQLLYRKKLSQKGRVLLTHLEAGYSQNQQNSQQDNQLQSLGNGTSSSAQDWQQLQQQAQQQQQYGLAISWVEPLNKKQFLEIKAAGQLQLETGEQAVKDGWNGQAVLNPALSNVFDKLYTYQTLTGRFQHHHKAYSFTLALTAQHSYLQSQPEPHQGSLANSYFYPLGTALFKYKFSKSSRLTVQYNSTIQEPTVQQLQPVTDNSNPLALSTGNPNLVPEYQHHASLNYHLFDQFSFTSLFINASWTWIQEQIIYAQEIDDFLNTSYTPINSTLGYQARLYADFGRPIKPLGIKFNVGVSSAWQQQNNQLNGVSSQEWRQQTTFKASIENRKKKVVDLLLGTKIEWNQSIFSINPTLNTSYVNYLAYVEGKVQFNQHWQLYSNLDYHLLVHPAFEQDWYLPLWAIGAKHTFVKAPQFQLEVGAHNLLNQTTWVRRFNQNNWVGETQSNTLGRYFLLSLQYKFSPVGTPPPSVEFSAKRH